MAAQYGGTASVNLPHLFTIFFMTALSSLIILGTTGLMWRRSLRSIKQYRYLLDQVYDCVYLLDAENLQFIYVNKSGRKQVGYSKTELSSMTPANIKPEFTIEELQQKFNPLMKGEKDSILFETVHLTKEGRLIPVEVLVQFLQIEDVGYFLAVARDITEKRAAITEKEMYEEKLQEVQRMEGIATLASGIAHDFNNLLTSILGYTELALLQTQDNRISNDLRVVLEAGNRARDLVQQILTFSREKSGPKKPCRLHSLVKEVVKMIDATMPSSVQVVQEINENTGVVMADPVQIHQLLMNLCVNALDAMEKDGGVLTVSLADIEIDTGTPSTSDFPPPGQYVRIRVMDTGHGMKPWIIARIFDPYFTTKEKGKGTGLGLAVVHGIVKGHGGYITVASKPGKGTTFDVYFPQEKLQRLEAGVTEKFRSEESQVPGLRIMVVDDEPEIVNLLERILTRSGHNVTGFSSVASALEAFRNAPDNIDLLLTDLDMPGKNGVDMAKEMKGLRSDLAIILCTGYDTTITLADLEQTGIRNILLKPFTSKDLTRAIARTLESLPGK